MDNLALKLIDEMAGEDAAFIIDSDEKAEWALQKISEETAESRRMTTVCDSMILRYQEQKEKISGQLESKTAYLREQLQQYFGTVPHKVTKTQEQYKLPAGTLKLKKQNPEFVRDNEALLKWIKNTGRNELVEVKESPKWSELKESITVTGENVITADGEIVEGVNVVVRPDKFEIDVG